MIDKIGKFWVVVKPYKSSELIDVLFQTDIAGLQNQFLGGLKNEDIIGIYKDETEAKNVANIWLGKSVKENDETDDMGEEGRVQTVINPKPVKSEDDKSKEQDLESLVWDMFSSNDNVTDEIVHQLSEDIGKNVNEVENVIYGLLSAFINAGNAKKSGITADAVDPKELEAGIKVEREHTTSPKIAERIALDHEAETPNRDYYLNPDYGLLAQEKKIKKTEEKESCDFWERNL